MIDIENKVIDTLQTAFTTAGKTIAVASEYDEYPESFPALMARQTGYEVLSKTLDESLQPHHARVTFQLDLFSNKKSGAKTEAKQLMAIADQAMQNMKFTTTSLSLATNYDRTITKATARYTVIVGEYQTVGSNKVYQMYR